MRALRFAAIAGATGTAVAAAVYGAVAALAWYRYGRASAPKDPQDVDALLDRFIPIYDVVERHNICVSAPAQVTFSAACEQDVFHLPLVRAIFRAREIVMRAPPAPEQPHGVLAATRALGWSVLAEVPGREIVMGAVTKPWEADVTFHALPPGDFAAFAQPGFVKIVWTIRADPVDSATSIFRTETRAVATDPSARERFRRYWSWASPGIALIRRLLLLPLKRDAERRARIGAPTKLHDESTASSHS